MELPIDDSESEGGTATMPWSILNECRLRLRANSNCRIAMTRSGNTHLPRVTRDLVAVNGRREVWAGLLTAEAVARSMSSLVGQCFCTCSSLSMIFFMI